MKNKKRTTIYDIAKKLNLNASSVSRALNNSSNISPATKKLILKTAKDLNYKQDDKKKPQTIGIIVPHIDQSFYSDVIAGLEEVIYQKGNDLVICLSNDSFEREIKCVNTLINQHVSCIIIAVSAGLKNDRHLKRVLENGIRLIQFDRVTDTLDTFKVLNDNEPAAAEAVDHLITQGYQRIALITGTQDLQIFKQNKAGYVNALKHHDHQLLPELIEENVTTREASAAAAQKLLSRSNPPDAIFATSDLSALGVLDAAIKMGLKVPGELGICGYANEPFTAITNPPLTTVDQFGVSIGKTIANLYLQEPGNNDTEPKIVSIKPKLIIRASTLRNGNIK